MIAMCQSYLRDLPFIGAVSKCKIKSVELNLVTSKRFEFECYFCTLELKIPLLHHSWDKFIELLLLSFSRIWTLIYFIIKKKFNFKHFLQIIAKTA